MSDEEFTAHQLEWESQIASRNRRTLATLAALAALVSAYIITLIVL